MKQRVSPQVAQNSITKARAMAIACVLGGYAEAQSRLPLLDPERPALRVDPLEGVRG